MAERRDTPSTLLSLRDVAVNIRGLEALTAVDLSIERGASVGVIGETGSGKTLTARVITGTLDRIGAGVTRGTVNFDGVDLVGLSERQWRKLRGRRIALVPQSSMSALDPLMKVGGQLTEAIRALTDERNPRIRARELLEQVQIASAETVLGLYAHELSGGMRQRVMIALAIVGEPDLIVADEPTTALDVTIQRAVLELLTTLTRESRTSLVLISHDLEVVRSVCDRVVIMYAGVTVEHGPTEEVLGDPGHPYTQALLSARPRALAPGELLVSIPGVPPALGHRPPGCPFAPRCSKVSSRCEERRPPPVAISPERSAACICVCAVTSR